MASPSPKKKTAPSSWPELEAVQKLDRSHRTPLGKVSEEERRNAKWKMVFTVLGFVVVCVVIATLFYIFQGARSLNIGLEFFTPSQISVGSPFSVTITFSNYSSNILKDATLSLILPDDISFLGQNVSQRVREQSLGDVSPQSIGRQQSFNLIATAGMQSERQLEARLSYADVSNPAVRFERTEKIDVHVGEPAVRLSFKTPNGVLSGETFPIDIHYENLTGEEVRNLFLTLAYPSVFQFVESDMSPARDDNYWELGSLGPFEKKQLSVTGKVIGPEQSFFDFQGVLATDISGQTYTVHQEGASVAISSAPFSVIVTTERGDGYVPYVGDTVPYLLRYRNNSDFTLDDVRLTARARGELFDFATVQSNAAFDSITNTLSWYVANAPELGSLAPGQEGTLGFSIRLKAMPPLGRISDKNYMLTVEADIRSSAVGDTISVSRLDTKVGGEIIIDTQGFWRDAASGIVNSGPFPPRVNQKTQYTIHWVLKNTITDAHSVQVSAPLSSGVEWTGTVKGANGSEPFYDVARGLVVWNVGTVPATKGIISDPLQAIFQIAFTPAVNQVGATDIEMLGQTHVQGIDAFTGEMLSRTDERVTTALPDDRTLAGSDHAVQP